MHPNRDRKEKSGGRGPSGGFVVVLRCLQSIWVGLLGLLLFEGLEGGGGVYSEMYTRIRNGEKGKEKTNLILTKPNQQPTAKFPSQPFPISIPWHIKTNETVTKNKQKQNVLFIRKNISRHRDSAESRVSSKRRPTSC